MMTLIEAIEHCKDMAKCEYGECAEEHRQLAEWLMELQDIKTHGKHTETHGVCSDLISRQDAIELLTKIVFDEPPYLDSETLCRIYAEEQINTLPSADAVSKGVYEQTKWERDVALKTLEEHGIGFGQKVDTDSDLISRAEAIEEAKTCSLVVGYQGKKIAENVDGFVESVIAQVRRNISSAIESLPSADRPTDEEDQLKFYYVESIDDYWIGMRIDNFYYADWHEGIGFVWTHSRYLPWGEHVVDKNTLWKEHTYPSEPVEMPFTDWIVGFVKKYFADRPTGEWKGYNADNPDWLRKDGTPIFLVCDKCHGTVLNNGSANWDFCPNCGAKMTGGENSD